MANFNKNITIYDNKYSVVKGRRADGTFRSSGETLADRQKRVSTKFADDITAIQDFVDTFANQSKVIFRDDNTLVLKTSHKPFDRVEESEAAKKALDILNTNKFFNTITNKTSPSNVTLKYHNLANINTTASYDNMSHVFDKYQNIIKSSGTIIGYDLETLGGMSDGIWNPLGITEFGINKQHIVNGKVAKTTSENIMLSGTVNHTAELNKIRAVLMSPNGAKKLAEDPQYRGLLVSAKRYSMYGHKDTKIHFDGKKGYGVIDSFVGEKGEAWGNLEQITAGVNKFINIEKQASQAIDEASGLRKDVKTSIDYIFDIMKTGNDQYGLVVGHNIRGFDNAALNQYVKKLYNSDKAAQKYITSKMGILGINTPGFHLGPIAQADSLNFSRVVNNKNYMGALLDVSDRGRQILAQAGRGINKQENIGAVFFPHLFEGAMAHSAGNDTAVVNAFFTHRFTEDYLNKIGIDQNAISTFKGKTLIEAMNDMMGSFDNAVDIKANRQQIFMANKTMSGSFGGKKVFNFTRDSQGNIITSTGHFINPNGGIEYNPVHGKQIGVIRNQPYTIVNYGSVNTSQYSGQLANLVPEFATDEVYYLNLEQVVGDKYKSRTSPTQTTMLFSTKEEMEGFMDSYLTPFAESTTGGGYKYLGNRKVAESYAKQYMLTDKGLEFNQQRWNSMFEAEQIKGALNSNFERRYEKKAAENFLFGDKSAKRIGESLDFIEYLNKKNLSAMTADDLGRIYYNKYSGMKVGNVEITKNLADEIRENIKDTFGFHPRDENGKPLEKKVLLDATADNAIASFEHVKEQEKYYRNALNTVFKAHNINPSQHGSYGATIAKSGQAMAAINNDFITLNDALSVPVANSVGEFMDLSEKSVRNLALNADAQLMPKALVDNMYEFKLSKDFYFNKKASNINGLMSPKEYQNIIQYSLDSSDPGMNFIDKLIKIQTGATRQLTETERIQSGRQVFYQFVNDELSKDKVLSKNQHIIELGSYVQKKDYNLRHALSYLEQGISEVREANPEAGVIRSGAKRGIKTNYLMSKYRNNLTPEAMAETMKGIGKTVDVSSAKGTERKKMVEKLVNSFIVDEGTFSRDLKALHGSNTDAIEDTMLAYRTLKKQYGTFVNDLIDAAGNVDMNLVFNEKSGRLFIQKGEKMVDLDNIARIISDQGALYGKSGSQRLAIHHVLEYDQRAKALKYRTNLDDHFGGMKTLVERINKLAEKGEVDPDSFRRAVGKLQVDLNEAPVYKYNYGSLLLANSPVDIRGVDPLYPELFKEDGEFHSIITRMSNNDKFNVDDLQNIMERRIPESLEPGKLDPMQRSLMSPDVVPILQEFNRATTNNSVVARILTHINDTGKETKETKGIKVVNELYIPQGSGGFDNYGRPVSVSAFNRNWIKANTIEEASKTYENLLIGARVIDTKQVHANIYKNVKEVGNLASDFAIRQLNMSNQNISQLVKYKRNSVIDSIINKYSNDPDRKYIADDVEQIMSEVEHIVRGSVYEQGKLMDPELFERLIGDNPQDVRKISYNLNAIPAIEAMLEREDPEKLIKTKIPQMREMFGELKRDENGHYRYVKAPGTIIKRGETIFPYEAFGDIEKRFGSKFPESVLSLKFRNKEGIELSEAEISKIINDTFSKQDINIKDVIDLFSNGDEFTAAYEVAHISQQELPKTFSNSAEKSMTRIPYAKAGSHDPRIRKVLTDTEKDHWIKNIVLRDETLDAWYHDLEKAYKDGGKTAKDILKQNGFDTIQDLKEAAKRERLLYRDFVFGENSIFGMVSVIANDNVTGHENMGHQMSSALGEAIRLTGKYTAKPGASNTEQWESGINKVAEIIASDPKKFGFIREMDNSKGVNEAKTLDISQNLSLLFSTNTYDKNKKGIEVLDSEKIINLFREINKTILKNAPEEDKLVHTNLEGVDELVGAVKTITVDGKRHAIGSIGVTSTAFAEDSEVQSGVSQEYLDAKKALRQYTHMLDQVKAIKPEDLTEQHINLLKILPERIEEIRNEIDAMSDGAAFMKVDDQLRNILSNSALNSTTERRLSNLITNSGDPYGYTKLIEEASDKLIARNKDGEFEINKKYKTDNVNKPWLEDVKQQITFNPLEEDELTEKMLKEEEYRHLEPIYNEVVRKRGMKLGTDSAELFYQGNIAYAGAKFNAGGNVDLQPLLDKGVEVVPAEKYVGNLGRASAGQFVSSYADKTILLDLGENYANMSETGNRYIAVPGLGNVVNSQEIKRDWQKTAGALANTWQEWSNLGFNDTEEGLRLVSRMDDLYDKLNTESQQIVKKGNVFAEKAKVRVNAPAQRLKIQATLGESELHDPLIDKVRANTPENYKVDEDWFRSNATILGKSVSEWEARGPNGPSLYYNYRLSSMSDFQNKGYFDYDFMRQMGFTKKDASGNMVPITDKTELRNEMTNYLKTHGTMDILDRYPNIYDTSALTSYTFLDTTLADNATAIAGHTLSNLNGDLDGDSLSTVKIAKNNVNYLLYNKHKEDSMAQMKADLKAQNIDIDSLDKDMVEENLRRNTIQSMKQNNVRGTAEELGEAYDFFRGKELESIRVAVDNAKVVRENVAETLAKDSGRAYKSMALSVDGKNLLAEVEGGRSSLGRLRTFNRRENVRAGELIKSDNELKGYFAEAVNVLDKQPDLFKGEKFKYVEGMREIGDKESAKTIVSFGNNQREALDEMLYILQKSGSQVADQAETAALGRIQQNKYVESLLFKGSKDAIGLVDAQLYAMKQASDNYFAQAEKDTERRLRLSGMSESEIRNSPELKAIALKRGNITLFSGGSEQDIISAKKLKMYAGDDRFMSFGGTMQSIRSARATQETREDFLNWFERYGRFSTVASQFDTWVDDGTLSESMINKASAYINKYEKEGVKDATEKGKAMYLAEQYYDTIDTLNKNNESFRADANLFAVFGRNGGSVERLVNVEGASGESHTALIQSLLSGQDVSYKEHDFEKQGTRVMADRLKNINNFKNITKAGSETLEHILEGGKDSLLSSPASIIGFSAIGLAIGVAAAGYAGGPLKKSKAVQDEQQQRQQANDRMTVPEFFDNQGGFVTGNSQQGYIININANTKKGERHMKRAMKEAVSASVGGAVSINMNFKSNSSGGWSDKDIEKIINNYM